MLGELVGIVQEEETVEDIDVLAHFQVSGRVELLCCLGGFTEHSLLVLLWHLLLSNEDREWVPPRVRGQHLKHLYVVIGEEVLDGKVPDLPENSIPVIPVGIKIKDLAIVAQVLGELVVGDVLCNNVLSCFSKIPGIPSREVAVARDVTLVDIRGDTDTLVLQELACVVGARIDVVSVGKYIDGFLHLEVLSTNIAGLLVSVINRDPLAPKDNTLIVARVELGPLVD